MKSSHILKAPLNQLQLQSQAPQQINSTGVPQPPHHYNQFRTGNPYTAPPTPQYQNSISSSIPQMSQYHPYPKPQNTAAGRPEPPPEISSQQLCPLHPQQDSGFSQPPAPFSQQVLSPQYAPNEYPLNRAFLPSPSSQQYAESQAVHQQSLPSHHLTTTSPNGHPLSHQRYSEKVNTTSSRGAGGPVSSEHLNNYNGDNSAWSPMNGLSRQNVQGSSIEPYHLSFEGYDYNQAQQHRTEQSIMHEPPHLDPLNVFPDQYQSDVTCENSGPDAGGDVGIQLGNREIRPGRQWSDPQEMGNQANPSMNPVLGIDPSTRGIDPSLIDRSFFKTCKPLWADVDETNAGGDDAQNEEFPRNYDDLDSHSPSGPSTSTFSRSDTVSRKTVSRAASSTAPLSRGSARPRAGHPFSSGSSVMTCNICDDDPDCERKPAYHGSTESQKSSLRRHKHKKHSGGQNWFYQCDLYKDGSACGELIGRADNRRRHVETSHPTEYLELPPKDAATRNPNDVTNSMLNRWFPKAPQSTG